MELSDLVIEIERYCSRNDVDKRNTIDDLIEHMNNQIEEE